MTRLIADIGGTNARFALVEPDGAVRDERYLLVRDYPDLAAAAEAYLGGRPRGGGGDRRGDAGRDRRDRLHQQPVALLDLRAQGAAGRAATWP